MSFFKFSPDLMTKHELESLSVGRKHVIDYVSKKLNTAADTHTPFHIVFIGQRGVGKTHVLLSIFHKIDQSKILRVRLSEEEYSITTVEDLLERILIQLNLNYRTNQILSDGIKILKEKKSEGKLPVVFVDNLQMLFSQMESDLPKLRAILQKDNPFSLVSSALSVFDEISIYSEPFYNFFENIFLRGLSENETNELILKRLEYEGKADIAVNLPHYRSRIKGVRILTGGNPRLIHSICEIMIQKNSLEDLEKNIYELLDGLTPYYQSRMESLSVEKRKIVDVLALASGPLSPTELAQRAKMRVNSVVTQIRRLEVSGVIEPVKFRKKKSVSYQVSEGLYRIWREMRSPLGLQRINLFVDFLKIWYSKEELFEEYNEKVDQFNKIFHTSKVEAKKFLTHLCYVSAAAPELELPYLPSRVSKFASLGLTESAEKEIDKIRSNILAEKNEPLRLSKEMLVVLSEFVLRSLGMTRELAKEALQRITPKVEEIKQDILKIENIDEDTRYIIHDIFRIVALYFRIAENNKQAESFINGTLYFNKFCGEANEIKAELLLEKNEPSSAIDFIETAISTEKTQRAMLLRMTAYTMLENEEEAFRDLDSLLANGAPDMLPDLFDAFDHFGRSIEFTPILQEQWQKAERLDYETRDVTIRRLGGSIIHMAFHAMEKKNQGKLKEYSKMLKTIKDSIGRKDMLNSFILYLSEFFKERDLEVVSEMIVYLDEVLGEPNIKILQPLASALDFIKTKNTDLLESLHKENRELVVDIIKRLSIGIFTIILET